ncbi:MAG: hypothetical protein ACLQU2_29570 [Candidatus Binataceae bacterium]
MSAGDLSQLWLRRALSFKNAADYVAWFSVAAQSARPLRTFECQALNALRGSSGKSRWSQGRLKLLRDTVLSLRVFVELNLECAQGCGELLERLQNLAEEAGEIFRKLGGKDRPAQFIDETPFPPDYVVALPRLTRHFAIDWQALEIICEVDERNGKQGDDPKARLFRRLKDALEDGILEEGQMAFLPTSPIPELREVPLVDGEWIDVFFIALARYGARLEALGGKPSSAEAKELWDEALGGLDKFGEIKEIYGCPHIRFSDYVGQADHPNGESCAKGITLASLLGWCDAATQARRVEINNSTTQPGTGTLAGGAADAPPTSALTSLAGKMFPELALRAQEWAERLKSLVADANQLGGLTDDCERVHFGGHPALFADLASRLGSLIWQTKILVEVCNAAAYLNIYHFPVTSNLPIRKFGTHRR